VKESGKRAIKIQTKGKGSRSYSGAHLGTKDFHRSPQGGWVISYLKNEARKERGTGRGT